MAMSNDDRSDLEQMIDRNSVQTVLEAIAEICFEKSEHIRASYDDKNTAGIWRRAANTLMQRKALEA